MISFPNVSELREFDSRRKKLVAMLAINMSILHETALSSDGRLHPRVTYLRDFNGTYFDPVLGARLNDGLIEVQVNTTAPQWRVILDHELIEDSFGILIYTPCDSFLSLDPDFVGDYEESEALN